LIKFKLTWNLESTIRLDPARYSLSYKLVNDTKEVCLDLRNYILRKSKNRQRNTFVLECMVPVQPSKVKFAISGELQNNHEIAKRIRGTADKALQ
jgi:hypothetical protein